MPPTASPGSDRRTSRRGRLYLGRRRFPRLPLDVDWFLQSEHFSSYGRGLEASLRAVRLPLQFHCALVPPLTLHLALPNRPRLFRAAVAGVPFTSDRGAVLRFDSVPQEDLELLAAALIDRHGLAAVPALDRKFRRFTLLDTRFLATSTSGPATR